jgi:hypothetical protein
VKAAFFKGATAKSPISGEGLLNQGGIHGNHNVASGSAALFRWNSGNARGFLARWRPRLGAGLAQGAAGNVAAATKSSREADGARLLKGALDLHFHMDPWTPDRVRGAGIEEVQAARARPARPRHQRP